MRRLTKDHDDTLYNYLRNSIDPRDVIIQLLFETGGRISEITPLGLAALGGRYIKICGLKGSRDRRVLLTENLTAKLERLGAKPTFLRYVSKTRSLDSGRRILTRHFHDLTLTLLGQRYNLHALRHTAISRLYIATKDIILTQRWAGHKSANSTASYIGLDNEEKANELMAAMLSR